MIKQYRTYGLANRGLPKFCPKPEAVCSLAGPRTVTSEPS